MSEYILKELVEEIAHNLYRIAHYLNISFSKYRSNFPKDSTRDNSNHYPKIFHLFNQMGIAIIIDKCYSRSCSLPNNHAICQTNNDLHYVFVAYKDFTSIKG